MSESEKVRLAAENDKLLKQVSRQIQSLQELPEKVSGLSTQMSKLMKYYYGPWRDDREELEKAGKGQFGVLSEDAIWDQMGSYRQVLEDLNDAVGKALEEYEQ